jgi:hypothetical protein
MVTEAGGSTAESTKTDWQLAKAYIGMLGSAEQGMYHITLNFDANTCMFSSYTHNVIMNATSLCVTGGPVVLERTELKPSEARQVHDDAWCARVDKECTCPGTKCGIMFKNALIKIRASPLEDLQDPTKAKKLKALMTSVKEKWPKNCPHLQQGSPTCDLVNMSRELLPRLGGRSYPSPDKWPYCDQSTIDDVRAMKYIRGHHAATGYAHMWQTLRTRLKQYADSGEGSIAEAIVYNAYCWTSQLAYEVPSDGRSEGAKRRESLIKKRIARMAAVGSAL